MNSSAQIHFSLLGFLILCLVISGCSNDSQFEKFENIDGDAWMNTDTLEFDYVIDSAMNLERAELHLRHTSTYQFRNLWLQVEHSIDDVKNSARQEIDLAAASGTWYGDKTGTYLNYAQELDGKFLNPGQHKIRIVQIMRQDPLLGIQSVGLTIE